MTESESRHRVFYWAYTDLYKWSILSQRGKIALQLTVFSSADYSQKQDFVFRTREAPKIASTIEYYIEKFMCVMHLRLEVEGGPKEPERTNEKGKEAPPAAPKSPMFRKHTDTDWDDEQEGKQTDWASDAEDDEKHEDFLDLDDFVEEERRRGSFSGPNRSTVSAVSPSFNGTTPGGVSNSFYLSPFDSPRMPPPPPIQVVNKGIAPHVLEQMEGWNRKLIPLPHGLLFEDEYVQVFVRQEYQLQQGMLTLLLQNQGTVAMEGLTMSVSSPTPSLLVQAGAVSAALLQPSEKASQQVRIMCMEPFQAPPTLQLEFTTQESPQISTKHTYPIPLPVSVLQFLTPLQFDRSAFLQQWQNITVPEVMDTFSTPRAINSEEISNLLKNHLRMGLVKDLSSSNETIQLITLACSLETGTISPAGKQLRVGALVRLEISLKASAIRLTIRAVHPSCASALFRAIKLQILDL